MAGIDSDEVRVAPFGNVYVAPPGTTLPSTATQSLNAAFEAVGYVDEDGVELSPNVSLEDIMAWQSKIAVKTVLDTVEFEVKFNMLQTNVVAWELFFFNETFSNNFGEGKLTLSSNPPSQEKALIVEWEDDEGDQTRIVLPRAVLSDRESIKLDRKSATMTGVTFKVLDNSGTIGYVYSENPDLTPST